MTTRSHDWENIARRLLKGLKFLIEDARRGKEVDQHW
jgi:hypothetical protein